MNWRRTWSGLVLLLWIGGLAVLLRRELFPTEERRLERAGQLVDATIHFYSVEQDGKLIGFGSSRLDTTAIEIDLTNLFRAETADADSQVRLTWQHEATLTRQLGLLDFTTAVSTPGLNYNVTGRRDRSDSTLSLEDEAIRPSRHRSLSTSGATMIAETAPLLVALGRQLRVGQSWPVELFDPVTQSLRQADLEILAESLFVVADSAVFDSTSSRWVAAHEDTIRAWMTRMPIEGSGEVWFDKYGRLVHQALPGGTLLRRTTSEQSSGNWRLDRTSVLPDTGTMQAPAPDPLVPTGRRRE